LQAKTCDACRYKSSDKNVESCSSDNDEDFNKSTSTYSSEKDIPWHHNMKSLFLITMNQQHVTKQAHQTEKLDRSTSGHEGSWDQVRSPTYSRQISIILPIIETMTNHH
jgi:hypothetical protein